MSTTPTTQVATAGRAARFRRAALALAASVALFGVDRAMAQDASDDAALEALIKAVDEDAKGRDEPSKAPEPKAEEPKRDAPADDAAKPKAPAGSDSMKQEPSSQDKELESLLESLGGSTDEPTTRDERKPRGPGGGDDKDQGPGAGGDPAPDQGEGKGRDQDQGKDRPRMTDADRALEEELEQLAGRRRKRDDGRGDDDGGGSAGPMGDLIKEMREVEKRLGEPDVGDETRGRQQQLVKRMETLIEQIQRAQQQQGQGRSMQQKTAQQGGKPGDQPGDQPGSNPGGAPNQRPSRPTDRRALAGGKDAWGHLPPELRQEMENVAKEDSLPASQELVRRYYLSVARGRLSRGD